VASDVDHAWCAGLFDGEGTTSVLRAQRDKYAYLRMSVAQKDRKVLDKFRDIVGVGTVYSHKTRIMHSLDIYKKADVDYCLDVLWPYLSEAKKDQANKAKEYVTSHSKVGSSCGV
jgi:hypothetical protein